MICVEDSVLTLRSDAISLEDQSCQRKPLRAILKALMLGL
jgi:hypothetical protein